MIKCKPADDGSSRIVPVDADGNESTRLYLNSTLNDLFNENEGVLSLGRRRI